MIGLYSANSQSITAGPFSFGNALQFDGVDDYVSFTRITENIFSMSFWFKTNNYGEALFGDSTNSASILRIPNSTSFRFANGSFTDYTVSTINLNTWYHFFVRRDSSNIVHVYKDGVLQDSLLNGSLSIDQIGAYRGPILLFDGIMDEIAIWNTDIGNQSANLYNSGNGDYATNYTPANLIAYWRMNGSGTDTTAVDEQGNYDGTLNNFPTSGMWVAH